MIGQSDYALADTLDSIFYDHLFNNRFDSAQYLLFKVRVLPLTPLQKIYLDFNQAELFRIIGNLDYALKTYDSIITNFPEKIAKRYPNVLSDVYRFRANVHFQKENYGSAYKDAIKSLEVNFNPKGYVLSAPIISTWYKELSEFDSAIAVLRRAEEMALKKKYSLSTLAVIYIKIAEINTLKKNKESAYHYINKAEKACAETENYFIDDQIVYEGSQKVYKNFGDYQRAHESVLKREEAEEKLDYSDKLKKLQENIHEFQREALHTQNILLRDLSEQIRKKLQLRNFLIIVFVLALLMTLILLALLYQKNKEIRKLNNKITEQNNLLLKQQESYRYIFSTLAHDLRGPLHSLRMIHELHAEEFRRTSLGSVFDILDERLEAQEEILQSLLNWARLELNITIPQNQNVPLHSVVQDVLRTLRSQIEDKKCNVSVDISDKINLRLFPDFLKIILRNILNNAIRYSDFSSTIKIHFNENGRYLEIQDFGEGISPEILESIKKQVTVDQSLQPDNDQKGAGVGLYLSAAVARKIGVVLHYESLRGQGTVVRIYFPENLLSFRSSPIATPSH